MEGDVMVTLLSPLEVFRRFIWNYFRLENEHLNNCGKFRAVRDISVAPMDCSDQVCIGIEIGCGRSLVCLHLRLYVCIAFVGYLSSYIHKFYKHRHEKL